MKLGWTVTGVDVSQDQLRVARQNNPDASIELAQADAESLPFRDGTFDAAISLFPHTDFGNYTVVLKEIYRVLRSDGRLVYIGTHPCYVTPYVERRRDAPHLLHAGYRRSGWTAEGPGFGKGIRPRVGVTTQRSRSFFSRSWTAGFDCAGLMSRMKTITRFRSAASPSDSPLRLLRLGLCGRRLVFGSFRALLGPLRSSGGLARLIAQSFGRCL